MTTPSDPRPIAQSHAVLQPNRTMDRPVEIPGKLPGVLIFLHGVNDPGASYGTVEKGICEGLNDRLDRKDLAPGTYGAAFKAALDQEKATQGKVDKRTKEVLGNPDANLYHRSESGATHSPFIPFYWGYRAADNEIAKDGQNNPVTMRGQYQDTAGNRLDRDFAKEGGYFSNATNNIPDMYDTRFRAPKSAERLTRFNFTGNYTYIADAPLRHYFVLAAYRLAMLIRTIRNVPPAGNKKPAQDTITLMGHSQGTIIGLLAQAILVQQGQRCADCLIMVDSPYSVQEEIANNSDEQRRVQTSEAKVKTLIDIVNAVTKAPFSVPALADLLIAQDEHHGRTGPLWKATQGQRPDPHDSHKLITFTERDNRGKVYCYFCPEDTVVALQNIQGIGTFGVPDVVKAHWDEQTGQTMVDPFARASYPVTQPHKQTLPVMDVLKEKRFYQRMWTRLERDHAGDGNYQPVLVGLPPAHVAVREWDQRRSAGPDTSLSDQGAIFFTQSLHTPGDTRNINAEALSPPYAPNLYGTEVIKGGQRTGEADKAGLQAPDRVAEDVALGNRYADLQWKALDTVSGVPDTEALKQQYNAGKDVDDQTQTIRATPFYFDVGGPPAGYNIEREETPNEARARMDQEGALKAKDHGTLSANSYHSGILNDAENHRWVTAMDMAIGQAVVLDDPQWRELLIGMGEWRYTQKALGRLKGNPHYNKVVAQDKDAGALIEATATYFQYGNFPSPDVVPTKLPELVTSETVASRAKLPLKGASGSW